MNNDLKVQAVSRMDVLIVLMEAQGDSIDRIVQWNYSTGDEVGADQMQVVGHVGSARWLSVEHEVDAESDSYMADGSIWTIWTEDWVYFPLQFAGRETIGSAPRNPHDHITFMKWQAAGEADD